MKQLLQKDLSDSIGKVVMIVTKNSLDEVLSSLICKLRDYEDIDKPFGNKDVDEPLSPDMRPFEFQYSDAIYMDDDGVITEPDWDYGHCNIQDEVYLLEESDKEYKLYINYIK